MVVDSFLAQFADFLRTNSFECRSPTVQETDPVFQGNAAKFSVNQNVRIEIIETYSDFRIHLKAIRLVLILLNFTRYFSHFSAFTEIYEFGVAQEIWISLLDVQDVGQIHAEERYAGRIYRP